MAMNFGLNDMYPSMGFYNTRLISVPETEDQVAFVDDDADVNNKIVDGSKTRSIWVSMAIIVAIVFVLSRF
ncbi:hypothetical protein [Priestia flexa]|uniref:hypothetical protein n=1 Tax=Priestia flexa TaxID=86664 RepID=UPI0004737758|nr:hypothetical protein [Priestia flexa]